MLRFHCNNCGHKIKAPDEYAGRKGKCPKCQQAVKIPNLGEESSGIVSATNGVKLHSGGQNTVRPISKKHQTYETPEKMRQCPYCGETILASAKKCKHCKEFLESSLNLQNTTGKSVSGISQLREEYESLQKERKTYNRNSLVFAVCGFVLLIIVFIFAYHIKVAPKSVRFLAIAAIVSLTSAFGYYGKYKGRGFCMGALCGCAGIVGLLLLSDYKKERMNEITAMLRTGSQRDGGLRQMPLPTRKVKTSGMAIASLILGIAGFFTMGLAALAGLILGILGLRSIKRSDGELTGNGLAIAGVIISSVSLVLATFIFITIFMPALSRVKDQGKSIVSMSNVKQLCLGMLMYCDENEGNFPPVDTWHEAMWTFYRDETLLTSSHNPSAGRAYAMNAYLSGRRRKEIRQPTKTVLFFESRFGSPPGGGPDLLPDKPRGLRGYVMGFVDGHAELVRPERLDELIWKP